MNIFGQSSNTTAIAATSSTINFQARLLTSSGNTVPDGNYHVEFKLFDASSSSGSSQGSCTGDSNCLWTETRTTGNLVRVANGYLSVNLGSVTSFPTTINWDQEHWLSVNIGGTGGSPSWDGEMTPRLKLTGVPYAFRAGKLVDRDSGNEGVLEFDTLTASRSVLVPDESGTLCIQSSSSCGFAASSGSGNYIQNGTSPQTADFNITGDGTIGGTMQAATVNATSTIQLNGTDINTAGTLSNVAYKNQNNNFSVEQTITSSSSSSPALTLNSVTSAGDYTPFLHSGNRTFMSSSSGSQADAVYATWDLTDDRWEATVTSSIVGSILFEYNYNGTYNIKTTGVASRTAGDPLTFTTALGIGADGTIDLGAAGGKNTLDLTSSGSNTGLTIGSDTNLYRSAANTLKTDDTFDAAAYLLGGTNINTGGTLTNVAYLDQNNAFTGQNSISGADFASALTLQGTTASSTRSPNLVFTDNQASPVSYYLRKDDTNLRLLDASNNSLWFNPTDAKITFGGAADTNLYRSNSNELTTDDSLIIAGDITIQGGDLLTNQTTFNLLNTTATTLNIGGAVDAGGIVLAGGSGSTGCTLDGSTGDLACSGNITGASTGTVGYWSRSGTTLQPATAGDAVTTSGNISTSGSGTITSAGLLTGSAGLSVTGAAVNLNASSNFATNINTGTSTGAVSIGNASAGAITLQSASTVGITAGTTLSLTSTGANNINITPGGTTNTGVLVKPTTDSTAAFQVQNTASNQVLNINTTAATISLLAPTSTYVGGADITGSTNSGTGNNFTGDVAVYGRYAYVSEAGDATTCSQTAGSAIGCEFKVFDVSDPSAPAYLGGADASGSTNSGTGNQTLGPIAVAGHYVFVGARAGDATTCSATPGSAIGCELLVFDISDPSAPTYVGGADASGSTNSGTGSSTSVKDVIYGGKYLYVTTTGDATTCSQTAGSAIGCEFKTFDISDPSAPTYVGGADASGSTNSGTGNLDINQIAVSGSYVYAVEAGDATTCSATPGSAIGCEFKVFDVSDPSAPAYLGGADASGSTNSGTGNLALEQISGGGNYVYVGSAGDATTCSATPGSAIGCELLVFDISDPSAPTYVGAADASGSTNSGTGNEKIRGIKTTGRYAYTTFGEDATTCSQTAGSAIGCEFKTFDVSDPSAPAYLGGADASGSTNSGTGNIALNNVYIAGRYAYLTGNGDATTCSQTAGSAIGCELKVFDISGIDTPSILTDSFEAGNFQVRNDGNVYGSLNVQGSLTVAQNTSLQGDLGVSGKALFRNSTDSTTAFQIQNNSGINLVTADTSNMYLNVGSGGTPSAKLNVIGTLQGAASGFSFNIKSTDNAAAAQYVGGGIGFSGNADADRVFGAIQGYHESATASNYAGALRFYTRQSGAASLSQVFNLSSTGAALFQNSSDSATAFQIQDLNNNVLVNVDTSGSAIAFLSGVTAGTFTTDIAGTGTGNAVCHSGTASNTENAQIVDCTSAPSADYAENYPVTNGIGYGDIVATGTNMVNTYDTDSSGNVDWTKVKGRVTQLVRSDTSYQTNTIGVVSDNHGDFTSAGYNIKPEDNPMPVALNGRIPVNMSPNSETITPGDYLTTSQEAGKAMKATDGGFVIGKALEAWDSSSGETQVMVFVEPGYWPGPAMTEIVQNSSDFEGLSAQTATINNLNTINASTKSLAVTDEAIIAILHITGGATFKGNITLDGHFIAKGNKPTIEYMDGAWKDNNPDTAETNEADVSISGNDTAGTITLKTGTNPISGNLLKLIFDKQYGEAPKAILSPANNKAAGLQVYRGATTKDYFILTSVNNPDANTVYKYDYFIIQNE